MYLRAVILVTCLGFSQAKLIDLSCKEIHQFVDGHNSRRLQLAKGKVPDQPAASEMKYMVWDEELAAKAAKWASKNNFNHNPDRKIGSGRFTTGENLYWYSTNADSYKLNPVQALDSWFNEYKDFTYKSMEWDDFGTGPDIGHYTQMAWSDSTYVGCAISQYPENDWTSFLVVCNYGPAGNIIGRKPYKAGSPSGALTCGIRNCNRKYGAKC